MDIPRRREEAGAFGEKQVLPRRFQDLLPFKGELRQLPVNELPQALRHADHGRLHPSDQFPARRCLPHHALPHQLIHHRDEKQWIALGALKQPPSQEFWARPRPNCPSASSRGRYGSPSP